MDYHDSEKPREATFIDEHPANASTCANAPQAQNSFPTTSVFYDSQVEHKHHSSFSQST